MSAHARDRLTMVSVALGAALLGACHHGAGEPSPLPAPSAEEVERCAPVVDSIFRLAIDQLPLAQPVAGHFELPAPVPRGIRDGGTFALDVRVAEYGRADLSTVVFHSDMPRGYRDKLLDRLEHTWFRPPETRGCRVPGVFRLSVSFVGNS